MKGKCEPIHMWIKVFKDEICGLLAVGSTRRMTYGMLLCLNVYSNIIDLVEGLRICDSV